MVQEAAEMLGLSDGRVRDLIGNGQLPASALTGNPESDEVGLIFWQRSNRLWSC
jgi:hypothetical protein